MTDCTHPQSLHGFTSTARHSAYAIIGSALLLLGLLGIGKATAKDLSLPYRNYPGFTCHHWNAQGECTDFSYYGTPTSNSYNYTPPRSSSSYNANRDCYDSRGYYDERYCDDYDANYRYRSSRYTGSLYNCDRYDDRYCDDYRYGDITVRVTGAPNPVYQDDLLTYSIYIRNDESRDRTIDVWAFLDPDTFFHSASDKGRNNRSDEVVWDRVLVRGRSSKTFSLTVRVDDRARDGDKLRIRVEADGSTDDAETTVRDEDDRRRDCYDSRGRYNRAYCDDYYDDDRDCYDAYGRYNVRYCDDYYDDDCRYTSSSNCDATVEVFSSRNDARVGELVTFTIRVRNESSSGRNFNVLAFLDRDMTYYSSSDNGDENGDEVEWRNIYVGGRASRTLTVSARVDNSARYGDDLTFRAEAGNDEDEVTIEVR